MDDVLRRLPTGREPAREDASAAILALGGRRVLEAGARFGKFQLVRRLGRGGMGEVWEAVLHGPEGFRKPVALKVLRSGPIDDRARDALLREGRLGALLSHPNLVTTLALGDVDGTWFVAMELVNGPSASGLLALRRPLPTAAVLDIGVQACAGLHHAHRLRVGGVASPVVHRDVKPGNLLVDRSGIVKVADLGISTFGTADRPQGGTPGYMPPEQAQGAREDHGVDVYALGVTLLVLATGETPARALAAPHELDRTVPGLGAVVARCVRPDPGDRWPTAAELGAALGALRVSAPPGPTLVALVGEARPDLEVDTLTPVAAGVEPRPRSRGNLPVRSDRFVGRAEVPVVSAHLRTGRLVTLAGLGGAGKTRLALEVARSVGAELPGGAWFFDLSDARTAPAMCHAVARALEVPLHDRDAVGQLGHAFRARGPALFVLDNLEQLVDVAAAAVRRWLDAAPEAIFLCTSRVALRSRDEVRVVMGSLSTADGVALFLERAGGVERHDPAEVAALVEAVDGLPLAIELAASRARVLPVADVRLRLQRGFDVLKGGPRDAPERHRSLHASLDASWELLSEAARVALAQASVFEGGFALDAAEAVVRSGQVQALDLLEELVDASLFRVDARAGRFSLHPLVRTYARERLGPEAGRAAEARHGAFYAQLGSAEALARTDDLAAGSDLENLVAACLRAVARQDPATAAGTYRAAAALLERRGPVVTGIDLGRSVLDLRDLPLPDRGSVALWLGNMLQIDGQVADAGALYAGTVDELARAGWAGSTRALHGALAAVEAVRGCYAEAERLCEDVVVAARAAGDLHGEAKALGLLGLVHAQRGRHEDALPLYRRALAGYRLAGDRRGEARVSMNLAGSLAITGRAEEGRPLTEHAAAVLRVLGDRRGEAVALANVGLFLQDEGRFDEAVGLYDRALTLHREVGDRRFEGRALLMLGTLQTAREDPEAASVTLREALAILREVGDRRSEGMVQVRLGAALDRAGRSVEARAAYEQALAVHREVGDTSHEAIDLVRLAESWRRSGRPDQAARILAPAEEAISHIPSELGLLWCTRARIALDQGDVEGARKALERARSCIPRGAAMGSWELVQALAETERALGGAAVRDRE